ncbi:hypothetical protein [Nostoc sp. 106C]|uniref:hypothetical protein n=1 Tax=Nostoc sp. 106C TaxID=1932667 RepID=UPI001066DB12|nr:hypothetical protein [Nostoc sp. 106C]
MRTIITLTEPYCYIAKPLRWTGFQGSPFGSRTCSLFGGAFPQGQRSRRVGTAVGLKQVAREFYSPRLKLTQVSADVRSLLPAPSAV